ncbi:MAG: membrane dipeptidase [Pseudomonadota bacterium]
MLDRDDILIIDGLQYINWTRELYEEARDHGVNAIHVTIAYWENTKETLANIGHWHKQFRAHADLLLHVQTADDITRAQQQNKLGIIFGLQNCSPIEDDLTMVDILHRLGVRIMQLSYNNQSLLATGCYEQDDPGITRFGREVIREMNRVGMVVDMSHSAERSTLEAMAISERPIAITHANPSAFHAALRNKSSRVLEELGRSGGMLGLSLYPFHLKHGSDCTLESFCQMVADTVELMGSEHVGIGSDLCQNWGYQTLAWMRSGRWAADIDHGEGSAADPAWPAQPTWFQNNQHFGNLINGLGEVGFNAEEIRRIMGGNWLRFFASSFDAMDTQNT